MARLESLGRVRSVHHIENDTVAMIAEEEGSVRTSSGMPFQNLALDAFMAHSDFLCVFCTDDIEPSSDHVLAMMDGDDRMVGFDIPRGREAEFKDRQDLVWLSDDFAMYPNAFDGDVRMVMMPHKITIIGRSEGIVDPILFYPSTTVDQMLKRVYGIEDDLGLASALVSFDVI